MTMINNARRAFITGRATGNKHHVPWAIAAFEDACTRCGDCVRACEEAVLAAGDGGFPTVDFARGGCSFCGACATACRDGAIDMRLGRPWRLRVSIGDECLSARGTTCRACGDACEERAIRFQLHIGGRAIPSVNDSLCNGCGNCIAICPTRVIQIEETA